MNHHFNWEEEVRKILDKYAQYEEHDEYHYDCDKSDGHVEFDDDEALTALSQAFKKAVEAAEPEKKPAKQYGDLSREGWQKYDTETGFNTATAEYKSNLISLIDGGKTE